MTFAPGTRVTVDQDVARFTGTVTGPCPWQTNTLLVTLDDGQTCLANPRRLTKI